MAARSGGPTQHRRQDRRQRLTLELLEQRQVMAASVAVGAGIGSSPIVTLLDAQTGAVRAQATAFETTFGGGVRVAMGDVDGDGGPEILAASGPGRVAEIRVFKEQAGSSTLRELVAYRTFPFGAAYRGGTDVACGDVDANGREDVVAAMSRGGGTVNIFLSVNAADPIANKAHRSFTPFGGTFDGGASVAVADLGTFSEGRLLNATIPDRRVEIVVGSGAGMPATVKAYDVSATPRVVMTIASMFTELQGGVTVASGLYNKDSIDDIVVSAGRGGGGLTSVYAGALGTVTAAPLRQFAAFASLAKPNAPVYTAPVDLNGDGAIDRFFVTQGNAGKNPGIVSTSTLGSRVGTISSPKGPLRIAAPRSIFPTVTTNSGLRYRDVVIGNGASPVVGKKVTTHYTGMLADGRVFDSSRPRNTPYQFTFGMGYVIKGFFEGLAGMKVGSRRILTIPADLAYGANPPAGSIIPKGATLTFEVELVAAQS
jgi:hypothetical protein